MAPCLSAFSQGHFCLCSSNRHHLPGTAVPGAAVPSSAGWQTVAKAVKGVAVY